MTSPGPDVWKGIRQMFPRESDRREEILEYIRIHPGCGSSEIRAYFDPCDGAGLIRVLMQMHKDGDIQLDSRGGFHTPFPVS